MKMNSYVTGIGDIQIPATPGNSGREQQVGNYFPSENLQSKPGNDSRLVLEEEDSGSDFSTSTLIVDHETDTREQQSEQSIREIDEEYALLKGEFAIV